MHAVAPRGPRVLELKDNDSRDALHQPDARLVELLHSVDDVDLEFRPPTERFHDSEASACCCAAARRRARELPADVVDRMPRQIAVDDDAAICDGAAQVGEPVEQHSWRHVGQRPVIDRHPPRRHDGGGGVSRPNQQAGAYRRWPDRGALLRDTLLGIATAAIPHEDTGSYRGDMLAVLRGWAALFTGPDAALLRAVIAAAAHDRQLTAAFQNDVIGWRKEEMAALLSRGIARGDVRADVPVEIARELGQSVLWHRLLITGDPITDELVVALVDDLLVPFVAPR